MSINAPAIFDHDLNQLVMTITRHFTGESLEVEGKAGDGIQINRMEPKYADLVISKDGKIGVRTPSNNRWGKILVTGIQYSPLHKQMALLDTADPAHDKIDIVIADLSNRTLYSGLSAWLSLFANAQYADAQGNRTHEITVPFLEMDKDL